MKNAPVKWAHSSTRQSVTERPEAENDDAVVLPLVERPPLRVMQEQRARDAAEAFEEYEANKRADEAKTARLRALRLAREASIVASKAA